MTLDIVARKTIITDETGAKRLFARYDIPNAAGLRHELKALGYEYSLSSRARGKIVEGNRIDSEESFLVSLGVRITEMSSIPIGVYAKMQKEIASLNERRKESLGR